MHRVVVGAGRAGRAALANLLDGSDFEVVAMADVGSGLVGLVARVEPDLVLVELEPVAAVERLVAAVCDARPSLPVVVLADASDGERVASTVGRGARGFLLRSTSVEGLMWALRSVVGGGVVIDPAVAGHVVDVATSGVRVAGAHGLSRAEERVLVHLPDRLTNREIGERVGISRWTVKTHLRNVYRKLGVRDRVEAAMFATEHGLT